MKPHQLPSAIILALSLALTAPTLASADTCGLGSALASAGKDLRATISVRKAEVAYFEGLGFEVHKGFLGARFIQSDQLIAHLALYGCDDNLIQSAVRNTRKPVARSSGKTGSSSDGGSSAGCSGRQCEGLN